MKITKMLMSFAVVALLFASCDDGKKKEAEMQAEKEKMEMEAQERADMEAKDMEMKKMEMQKNSIASKAMANPKYSTLVSALKQAGLAETFMAEGEYTVLAPTNDAFDKVPKATMDMLMMGENKAKLQNILKYHVIAGQWDAAAIMKAVKDNNNAYNVTTLAGENLVISMKGDNVMIKDSKGNMSMVADANMTASNGVIHGIDKVLMPKG